VRVAVLRAGTIVGPGVDSWLGRAMAGAGGVVAETGTPARQFVHVDDVAAAVAFAAEQELDGVYNVAPDGSVRPDEVRSLVASRPRLPVPDRFGATAANLAWGLHLSDVSPEVLPLLAHPWVIANDRLRAAGWEPRYTSEEAVIAGRPGSRWREMSPGRRQEVTLAVAGAGIAAAVGGIAAGVIRFSRRR
jgi:nucleoside-diphosphate-sugar epimerase